METNVRQEEERDYDAVFDLIEKAFSGFELSDHKEQFLVQRLRKSSSFVPELSLVAEYENKIVGHILLTKIKIKNKQNEFQSLSLAPLAVLPEYQKRGIGGKLIEQAHKNAVKAGFGSVIVVGHAGYYPKFGYQPTNKFGIQLSFDVPQENLMALELVKNSLKNVNGTVEFPEEFFKQ